jgi:hypothetical protein
LDIIVHPMKKFAIVLVAIALLGFISLLSRPLLRGLSHDTNGFSTTVRLSGTPGAAFTGEYVQEGKRVSVSGVVPWSLTESNISRLEIRKARMEDTLVLEAHGGGSTVSASSNPDSKGLRVKTEGGWNVECIR